jgi:hypothetical protein
MSHQVVGTQCSKPGCAGRVPDSGTHCVVCLTPAGYPNVRAAEAEADALRARFATAQKAATAANAANALALLGAALENSVAVICRNVALVHWLVSDDNALYTTYYRQVSANARIPESNQYDKARESVDSAVFPGYHREITFGALSLSGIGQTAFGPCSIVLRTAAIESRASLFDSPLFPFFERRKITVGTPVPLGYRAPWRERSTLAGAKLAALLTEQTTAEALPDLLVEKGADTTGDCIEVHIYGAIHRGAIERVILSPKPLRRPEQILVKSLRAALRDIGIQLEAAK